MLKKRGVRGLREKVLKLLRAEDFDDSLDTLLILPGRQVINPLLSLLCHHDQYVKWRAVTAIGQVVAHIAKDNLESARVIMRRLMWMLNDESGGIGWGAPEAMAEIMACHEGLAWEYTNILISYMEEEAGFLEYEALQRGVVWGIGRLAQARLHVLRSKDADRYLQHYLNSSDATVRGLAAWALGLIGAKNVQEKIEGLVADHAEIELYCDRKLVTRRVSDLAREALTAFE